MKNPRSTFARECLSSLGTRLKGSGWRKRGNVLFVAVDGQYVEASVLVHRESKTTVECAFKPMALDPILWDISATPECLEQPLSFRSFGFGQCSTFPLAAADIEAAGDHPTDVAARILPFCSNALDVLRGEFLHRDYSDLMALRADQGARGNIATTRILALISEGKPDAAREAAKASLATWGPVSPAFHRVGKSFEHQILRWLDSRAPA